MDALKFQIEALTGGKNTVLYDDKGEPSIMVRIPKFKLADVLEGGADEVHPAFLVDGKEKDCLYISKYQNVIEGGRAYSLPYRDPGVLYSFHEASEACSGKGANWHLMTNAEWAAIALLSRKKGTVPRGNTCHGSAHDAPHERGVIASAAAIMPAGELFPPLRVAVGSGPVTWSHDGTDAGIYDMTGNVWEMVSGARLLDGELHIIENNDAANGARTFPKESEEWKALDDRGSFVEPGHEDALIYSCFQMEEETGRALICPRSTAGCLKVTTLLTAFEKMETAGKLENTALLQALCLYPEQKGERTDVAWALTEGERFLIRGGYWVNKEMAGMFAHGYFMGREDKFYDVGFRACYYED